MSMYTVYSPSTGDIKFNLTGSVVEGDVPEGLAVTEGLFENQRHYFDNGTFIERSVMNLNYPAGTVSVGQYFRVDNIPEGATLKAAGNQEIVINDGFFEWTTDFPGQYSFEIILSPYLPTTITANFV